MRYGLFTGIFILCFAGNILAGGGIQRPDGLNTIYVFSIGVSSNSSTINVSNKYANAPCPVCLSDAGRFGEYLKKLKQRTGDLIDTVISYQYLNADIDIDDFYKTFKKIQVSASAGDIFVFYYASSSWGMQYNPETFTSQGYYSLNNKLKDSAGIGRYSFNLGILKALTDRIAAKRQLIIFDTGVGEVIMPDYYKNFFSDKPAQAAFTKKNRIVICPEFMSSESMDKNEKILKGDLFKVISNLPDSLNVFTFFSDRQSPQALKNYKFFMKDWYALQLECMAQLKVLQETEYLQILSSIRPKERDGKRGATGDDTPVNTKADSSFETRKKKALVIATNLYDAPLWEPLRNAINDGKTVATILNKDYGYEVDTLFNASNDMILEAITKMCDDAQNPYNQYIIYFAGHGYYDPRQKNGYVVCRDSKPIKELSKPSMVELKSYLDYTVLFKKVDASLNKVVMITDVCFGGTALNSVLPVHPSVDPMAGKDKQKNPYKRVLASGITRVDDFIRLQNGEISDNSPFAIALIDILKSKKTYLTFETLFSDIALKKLSPDPVDFIFGTISKPSEFVF